MQSTTAIESNLRAVLAQFTSDPLLHFRPIDKGLINDTFLVRCQDNSYVLQRLNHRVFAQPEQVVNNTLLIQNQLRQNRAYPLQIPAMFPTKLGGHLYHTGEGNCWRLFEYMENSRCLEVVEQAADLKAIAGAYGAFTAALDGFDARGLHETIPGFHDTMLRWTHLEDILKIDPVGRLCNASSSIEELRQCLPLFDAIHQMKLDSSLRLRPTHNDTKASNVLLKFDSPEAIAVIDLDTVMPGTVLSDFGDMVRSMATIEKEDAETEAGIEIDPLRLGALYSGFLEACADQLTAEERNYLYLGSQWMAAEQALRFVSDYLSGDTYYKTDYPEHNLVRARKQLALFRALKDFDWDLIYHRL